MPEETWKELTERLEKEGKEICMFKRMVIDENDSIIIIKTCPKK